jgi:hypothetical protein
VRRGEVDTRDSGALPTERTMTLWKTERAFSPLLTESARSRSLDAAALAVIVATPAILLLWLIPLPLVLPVLSIVSFAIACVVAIIAHYSGIDRRAPGVSAWDIAALFTVIWIGAGMLGGVKQFGDLFERLALTP